jgi:hypothetical protein
LNLQRIPLSCFYFLPLGHFFGSTSPTAFFRPNRNSDTPARAGAVKVGRRSDLSTNSAASRPHLDGSEHGGRLGRLGWRTTPDLCVCRVPDRMTMSRGARSQDSIRCHNLVFGGRSARTMMHACASAAKLRGGGPILNSGMEAMAKRGTPPPRTVIVGSDRRRPHEFETGVTDDDVTRRLSPAASGPRPAKCRRGRSATAR